MPYNLGTVFPRKQDNSLFLSSLVTSLCLFVLSVVLYSARANHISQPLPQPRLFVSPFLNPINQSKIPHDDYTPKAIDQKGLPSLSHLGSLSSLVLVPLQSVTAILPILSGSLEKTQDLLEPFVHPLEHLCEVVIICPDAIVSDVRRMLQKTFASLGSHDHPDVSLRPWQGYMELSAATFKASMDVATDWILIMDETGLSKLSQSVRYVLLNPPNISLPFGPRGVPYTTRSTSSISTPEWAQAAHYVYPPFLVSSSLLDPLSTGMHMASDPWHDLGKRISEHRSDRVGGMLITIDTASLPTPSPTCEAEPHSISDVLPIHVWETSRTISAPIAVSGHFVFLLPTRDDLRSIAPLICRMKSKDRGIQIRVLVYAEGYDRPSTYSGSDLDWETEFFETYLCDIEYEVLTNRHMLLFSSNGSTLLSRWLTEPAAVNVVLTLYELDILVSFVASDQGNVFFQGATHIRMPRLDLANTEWMSALSLEEWRSWHRPRIDISIITKDRPAALTRLLHSLETARYFGDQLDLRVNVEQDCDAESLRIAENITWPFGRVFIHHRVVHGGLLPAVVESWYPQDNHSYGLLLEDDIEVSPLYYAWLKMTVLRYRYGDPSNRTPNMFGISLYQQKHLELHMEGRQAFNPRALFSRLGMPYPDTPYLSPVPCSWGAIYFPEHWREFHDYLAVRLGEAKLAIDDEVVPDVRSNHWSKSWKKFFIELVYLRGYVMLYPNYEDFVSLSTNHLEVGSHVKVRSAEKQDLFLLPLMQLQKPQESSKLLDLPHGSLPSLEALPILNLTGHVTSQDALVKQGHARRAELINCGSPADDLYNVRSLMCVSDVLSSGLFR